MGPTTVRKWFFAWASSQNIEFRQQCPGCGTEPVLLAVDRTKISIEASAKNKKTMNFERSQKIVISSSKQCRRSRFPVLHEPIDIKKNIEKYGRTV